MSTTLSEWSSQVVLEEDMIMTVFVEDLNTQKVQQNAIYYPTPTPKINK